MANSKLSQTNKWEYAIPILAIASLIVSCIIVSSKKYFWNDELYSYYFLADQSFTHMMAAFHDKINNTPPLYFVLGWLWAKVFGSSELSLRLFSSLDIGFACLIVWITLRRTYNFWSASIGTLAVFCTSELILSQNAEARMYGLFVAFCALGLLLYDVINRHLKCSWSIIWGNFFTHAAIIHTHLFGPFYSGAILVSFLLRDRYFKLFRPKIYLSIVLSWLSIILYIPAFLIQSDAGNPRAWVPIPTLKDLLDLLSLSSSSFFKLSVLLLLLVVSALQFLYDKIRFSQNTKQNYQDFKAEISLLIFAYAFLAVPIFVWLVSRTVKPIFWDRYLIPTTLSWTILLAYLSSRIIDSFDFSQNFQKTRLSKFLVVSQRSIILLVLSTILLIQPIGYAKSYRGRYIPGFNDNTYGYKELPIVAQASAQFIERLYYSSERDRYFFILDWQAALDKASGQFGLQEYKHLDAWKRNYPEVFENVLQSEDFLDKYERFLVLDYLDYDKKCPPKVKGLEKAKKWEDMHCPRWVEKRLINNSSYRVTFLGKIYGESVLLVEKKK